MTFTADTHVGEIAAALPASTRVFHKYGIDFCCGGKKPLGAVCDERHLPYDEIARAIAAACDVRIDTRDWTQAPLADLITHIVVTYHVPLQDELPRLRAMAARVHTVHGATSPMLERLSLVVNDLVSDLIQHMQKEEIVLFPAIQQLEATHAGPFPIAMPISMMEREHDRAGELLAELRAITQDYTLPEWACATYRALYAGLDALEHEMHDHIHLENNVLFPRALQLTGPAEARRIA